MYGNSRESRTSRGAPANGSSADAELSLSGLLLLLPGELVVEIEHLDDRGVALHESPVGKRAVGLGGVQRVEGVLQVEVAVLQGVGVLVGVGEDVPRGDIVVVVDDVYLVLVGVEEAQHGAGVEADEQIEEVGLGVQYAERRVYPLGQGYVLPVLLQALAESLAQLGLVDELAVDIQEGVALAQARGAPLHVVERGVQSPGRRGSGNGRGDRRDGGGQDDRARVEGGPRGGRGRRRGRRRWGGRYRGGGCRRGCRRGGGGWRGGRVAAAGRGERCEQG